METRWVIMGWESGTYLLLVGGCRRRSRLRSLLGGRPREEVLFLPFCAVVWSVLPPSFDVRLMFGGA